jgi:phosphoribosylaminoimidazole-succinocarboxamide synthase
VSEAAALQGLEPFSQGKVRDIYAVDDQRLLLVASDRISTYDVVHPTPIPDKGKVLTGLSEFWFERTRDIVPNHLVSYTDVPEETRGRAMLVERLQMAPVECVVRGYITGSGWKDYQASGVVCGIELPAGLEESEQLPQPIFTPATKAESGHDENITIAQVRALLGVETANALEQLSRLVYARGRDLASARGIIIADTKFEFGRGRDGRILLIDEVLTPDSSRFWPADRYAPGGAQPSFDKQPLRDYLDLERRAGRWNGDAPPPPLPETVIAAASERYRDAFQRITGAPLDVTDL